MHPCRSFTAHPRIYNRCIQPVHYTLKRSILHFEQFHQLPPNDKWAGSYYHAHSPHFEV